MPSMNKACLMGHLGQDPSTKEIGGGNKVTSFSLATSNKWKDKHSGEWKSKTQWHKIVIFNKALSDIAERFLHKGSLVYIEGAIENREWDDKEGQKRKTTEIVMKGFDSKLVLLDSKGDSQGGGEKNVSIIMDDDIDF